MLSSPHPGSEENSWYITLPLSSCKNLFEKEETGFWVQGFACSCGTHEIYLVRYNTQKISHVCPQCENSIFTNSDRIANGYNRLLVHTHQNFILKKHQKYASVSLFMAQPSGINIIRNKVLFTEEKIYEYRLYYNGGVEETLEKHKINNDTKQAAYHALINFIAKEYLSHKLKNYAYLNIEEKPTPLVAKIVRFFLTYPLLTDAMFFKWQIDEGLYHAGGEIKDPDHFLAYLRNRHNQKSVKKALYTRYFNEIEYGKFKPLTPHIICRAFDDPNHICRLLLNDEFVFSYFDEGESQLQALPHIALLIFLKQYYTESQLVSILERLEDDPQLWVDSVNMFSHLDLIDQVDKALFKENFCKPRANMQAIHDALIRSRHIAQYAPSDLPLTYAKYFESACGKWQDLFDITLPRTAKELTEWSATMNNCLYGFVQPIHERDTIVYGIYRGDTLRYNIEIQNNEIIQMYGKHNRDIEGADRQSLLRWHQKYFM